jgi:ketosteroid isomerase-like protein
MAHPLQLFDHPLELTIRRAYHSYDCRNLDGFLEACSEDFSVTVPGLSPLAGIWKGKAGLQALTQKLNEIACGTLRQEIEEVLANDRHAVVLVSRHFTRDGVPKDCASAHVYQVRHGKLAQCWEQPQDLYEFDRTWGV